MLSIDDAKIKGVPLKYDGTRAYLKGRKDLRTSGTYSGYNNSVMVEYTNNIGTTETDWVGVAALTKIENPAVEYLNAEKAKLLENVKKIDEALALLEGMKNV